MIVVVGSPPEEAFTPGGESGDRLHSTDGRVVDDLRPARVFPRERKPPAQLTTVKIEKPDDANFVLGQTHFIKSVEDIHEALVTPGLTHRFSLGETL